MRDRQYAPSVGPLFGNHARLAGDNHPAISQCRNNPKYRETSPADVS